MKKKKKTEWAGEAVPERGQVRALLGIQSVRIPFPLEFMRRLGGVANIEH